MVYMGSGDGLWMMKESISLLTMSYAVVLAVR
jgi:hypothetical protein